MPSVTIPAGVPYAFDEVGSGSPLLLVHAGIADRRMWNEVLPAIGERHRVLSVDLRGFGDTPLPDGPFTYATDLAAVLEALSIRRAHLCGVSMGAGVVLELALDRRDLTDMLVLVAPGLPEWDWDPSMADFAEREAAALERGDLTQASWLNVDFWLAGPFRSPDEVDARLRRNVYEMQRRAFELDNPAAEGTWLMADRQERLGNLEAPTLIVVGELDHADFVEVGRHMATRIPDARLEIVPGVAHLPPMETPDRFARLVLDFLNG